MGERGGNTRKLREGGENNGEVIGKGTADFGGLKDGVEEA